MTDKNIKKDDVKQFHVIWKRPDGFHGAHPSDFRVIDVGHCKIWLHKRDHDDFPFKVSGGWEADEATKRLNNLLNVIDEDDTGLAKHLERIYDDRMKDDPAKFIDSKISWIKDLKNQVKGDTWETEIMKEVFVSLVTRIEAAKILFNRMLSAKNG